MGPKQKTLALGALRLTNADLAAILLFAALAVYLFLTAPVGITESDEALYLADELRLMQGERLYADDWTLSPFSMMFSYAPLRLFYALTGGSEGVLLALRYFAAALKLALFALAYFLLRSNGYWAALAAAAAAGASAFGLKTLNYYAVCSFCLVLTGAVLFVKKEVRPPALILTGFVFSCAVLSEPGMAAVWAAYTALALFRWVCKKKGRAVLEDYDFILSSAVWRRLLYGVLLAAFTLLVLCVAYFMRAPLEAISQGFVQALNDPERSGRGLSLLAGRIDVIRIYIRIYHPALFYPFVALIPVSLLIHRFTDKYDWLLLGVLGLLYVGLTLRLLLYPMSNVGFAIGETVCHPFMLCLLGLVFYGFSVKKDKRLFAFLLLSLAAVVCGDMISMSAFGAFSEVGAVPAVLLLRGYVLERREQKTGAPEPAKKKKKAAPPPASAFGAKALGAVLAAVTVFLPLSELAHYAYMARLHETEQLFVRSSAPVDTVIARGALKGIVTTKEIAENYNKSLRDAETVRGIANGRLYVADLAPSVYLDADLPVAAHSPYYHYGEGWDRVSLWWRMHPEKKPDVVYIPWIKFSYMEYPDASPEEKLEHLRSVAEIDVAEGEIGYIVKIVHWK